MVISAHVHMPIHGEFPEDYLNYERKHLKIFMPLIA